MAPSIPFHSTWMHYFKNKRNLCFYAWEYSMLSRRRNPCFTCQCLIFWCLFSMWLIHCLEGLCQRGASVDVPEECSNTGVIRSLKGILKQLLSSWTTPDLVVKWSYFARSLSGEQEVGAVSQSAYTYVQIQFNSCSVLHTAASQFWTGAYSQLVL